MDNRKKLITMVVVLFCIEVINSQKACGISYCTTCTSPLCTACSFGYTLSSNKCISVCGDKKITGTETCDDGNRISHDGCSSTCQMETCNQSCLCYGWVQPWIAFNSTCSTLCGDGYLRGVEQCDDGNIVDHDGCSSTCIIQTCSQNCSCDGWTKPFLTQINACNSTCGDKLLRGLQKCDDGNLLNHDGCSSTCQIEKCSQSCLCDGWYHPFVNGSCSTICGDNLTRGVQECDGQSAQSMEVCSWRCTLQDPIIVQKSYTIYPSLALFFLGFRTHGIEMLDIIQNFQLIGQTFSIKQIQSAYEIHGYLNVDLLPFKISSDINLFTHFNFMFQTLIIMFGIFVIVECIRTIKQRIKNNKIANQDQQLGDTTIKSTFYSQGDLTNYEQNLQVNNSESNKQSQSMCINNSDYILQLMNKILQQLFCTILLNCLSISIYSITQQMNTSTYKSFQNLYEILGMLLVLGFVAAFLHYLFVQHRTFTENLFKFYSNRAINYWLLIVTQKVIFSFLLAITVDNSLYIIGGFKLISIAYFIFSDIFSSMLQKIRNLLYQFFHLLLIALLIFNKDYYYQNNYKQLFPSSFLNIFYLAIIGFIILMTLFFHIKQLISIFKCVRQVKDDQQQQIQETQNNNHLSTQEDAKQLDNNQISSTQQSFWKNKFSIHSNRVFDSNQYKVSKQNSNLQSNYKNSPKKSEQKIDQLNVKNQKQNIKNQQKNVSNQQKNVKNQQINANTQQANAKNQQANGKNKQKAIKQQNIILDFQQVNGESIQQQVQDKAQQEVSKSKKNIRSFKRINFKVKNIPKEDITQQKQKEIIMNSVKQVIAKESSKKKIKSTKIIKNIISMNQIDNKNYDDIQLQ